MEELIRLSGRQIAERIARRHIGSHEVREYFRGRIAAFDSTLNSFVEVYGDCPDHGIQGELAGVPIAVKDNICIRGKKITCASRILDSHIAVYDATVIERLRAAGLCIIGTTNMDEFAFGSSTESSCYGTVHNPWNSGCVPGGSSGGSAAAVAARLVPFAIGSDTGGSIRQPASLCGVVGFKPTYGRISRYGLIAFASSLDQIGPITTTIDDAAFLLNIMCGHDERDSTSAARAVPDFTKSIGRDCSGLRIGIPVEYFGDGLSGEVRQAVQKAASLFKAKNIQLIDIHLPHTEYAVATYYIVASSEASSNLQRFDGIRYGRRAAADSLYGVYAKSRDEGLGSEAKRRIFLGTYSLSSGYYDAYYLKACKVRRLIKSDFDNAFAQVDAILTPTSPTTAFTIGERTLDPLRMYLSDIYTISANLAGLPAVSFPCGFSEQKLPIGAQLIGKPFDEETLIALVSLYQNGTDFHSRIPTSVL